MFKERPQPFYNPGETGGSLDRALKYPRDLVHRYGAKAGVLMYVAKELPNIPQAPMDVTEPGETASEFLQRIKAEEQYGPWVVRSSAVVELDGYEGTFPSRRVDWEGDLERIIEHVRVSPHHLKGIGEVPVDHPDTINVILAEEATSQFVGTYIKHPNVPDNYLIAVTRTASLEPGTFFGAERNTYAYSSVKGVEALDDFTVFLHKGKGPSNAAEQLSLVASWHDQIASLPEMDPSWAYQIEFGINPPCLFQVRPFKPYETANFKLPENEGRYSFETALVIGVTQPEGIVAKVKQLEFNAAWEMVEAREKEPQEGEPIVIVDRLRAVREAKKTPNLRANILGEAFGFLAHDDIAVMRKAQVTALFPSSPLILGRHESGDTLRIVSDGQRVDVRNIDFISSPPRTNRRGSRVL